MSVKSSSLKENENVSKIEFFSTPKLSRNIFNGNEEDKNSLLDQSIDDLVHNLEQRLLLSSPTCDKENHHNLLECNRSDCCSICLSPLKSDSRGNRNLKLTKCQHMFHESCLNESRAWMASCPLCRTSITPSSTININTNRNSNNMVSLTQGTSYMTARRMLQLHFSPGNAVFTSEDF